VARFVAYTASKLVPCHPGSAASYIIRGALERAVRWHHLSVNEASPAIAPSPERTEPAPPSADEAARSLNAG
jgi:hypothetical protein